MGWVIERNNYYPICVSLSRMYMTNSIGPINSRLRLKITSSSVLSRAPPCTANVTSPTRNKCHEISLAGGFECLINRLNLIQRYDHQLWAF